jgi:glycerol-3-phosphate dehydrogenase
MNRLINSKRLAETPIWDVLVIGGGATGLGTALDAVSRGLNVLLIEKYDFGKGTSSRSTKLVHGGVRYLKNGDISLVVEALRERGLMLRNAPHLVRNMSFIIPTYDWWSTPFYGVGLKIYDLMAGKLGLGPSQMLNKEETIRQIPNVNKEQLNGGVIYHDGQFDDARMAISLAHTIDAKGGCVLNYMEWNAFLKENDTTIGVKVTDVLSGETMDIKAKIVINATGVFAEKLMKADNKNAPLKIRPSQGVHLVLDRGFLNSENAIMVPNTSDGRVLFAVPWNDHVVVGTTDTEVSEISYEPKSTDEEINFILANAEIYMTRKPTRADVKSVYVGLRPLISATGKSSKALSRKHLVDRSESGLINVLGGKWTTYRKMGEDAIDLALKHQSLTDKKSGTEHLQIFGFDTASSWENALHVYGSEQEKLNNYGSLESLSDNVYISEAQIRYGVQEEMVFTLEDMLARRTRCLFLDAKETVRIAPKVAEILADELDKDQFWQTEQINQFNQLASNYIL